jgi:hypothetical protein
MLSFALRRFAPAPGILDARGEGVSAMKSVAIRIFNPIFLASLLLGAAAATSCVGKSNPVLPSTGHGGLVASGSVDGGTPGDGLASSDVDGLATSDVRSDGADSAAPGGPCDLLTYVRTQKGCLSGQACYPVSGSGRCQDAGGEGVGGSCGFGETTPLCLGGLTCIITVDMLGTCLSLCDVSNPIPTCGPGNSCHPLPGFTTVGYCQSA